MSPLSFQQADLSTTSSICCQPDCLIHTEAFHAAAVLLTKIIALPVQFVHQWQPDRTDEIFFWLSQQVPFEAVSPSRPTHSVSSLPFQPTRQDADLLRICEYLAKPASFSDGDSVSEDPSSTDASNLENKKKSRQFHLALQSLTRRGPGYQYKPLYEAVHSILPAQPFADPDIDLHVSVLPERDDWWAAL